MQNSDYQKLSEENERLSEENERLSEVNLRLLDENLRLLKEKRKLSDENKNLKGLDPDQYDVEFNPKPNDLENDDVSEVLNLLLKQANFELEDEKIYRNQDKNSVGGMKAVNEFILRKAMEWISKYEPLEDNCNNLKVENLALRQQLQIFPSEIKRNNVKQLPKIKHLSTTSKGFENQPKKKSLYEKKIQPNNNKIPTLHGHQSRYEYLKLQKNLPNKKIFYSRPLK